MVRDELRRVFGVAGGELLLGHGGGSGSGKANRAGFDGTLTPHERGFNGGTFKNVGDEATHITSSIWTLRE